MIVSVAQRLADVAQIQVRAKLFKNIELGVRYYLKKKSEEERRSKSGKKKSEKSWKQKRSAMKSAIG